MESMARRLSTNGTDEIARIRREFQNNEGALQRRIEEVKTELGGFGEILWSTRVDVDDSDQHGKI